jgi:hypothetical protein
LIRLCEEPDPFLRQLYLDALAQSAIKCRVMNEFAQGAAGELAMADIIPEIWLLDQRDLPKATEVLAQLAPKTGDNWHCRQCHEINGGAFEVCWQCGQERDES